MSKKYLFFCILSIFGLTYANGLSAHVDNQTKTRKAVLIIVDGIPAQTMERLQPPTMMSIASQGRYHRAYCGGEIGSYSETPTVSAIGYTNILTGTWMNKHNVTGNDNLSPNYHYPTLFRIAKDQQRRVTTALYSSWTDNRTVLLGEKKDETRNLTIDYVFDGYDNDKTNYPDEQGDLHIQKIDGRVCQEAAQSIRTDAPDLSWIYLWYPDDAFHAHGHGTFTDKAVMTVDEQLAPVWEAIQYRMREKDEEWLVVLVTDHGRGFDGHHHGGQSADERTVWVITNQRHLNRQFFRPTFSHVDINPTICQWMGFQVAEDVAFERDGISFLGKTDIYDLKVEPYDNTVRLRWQHEGPNTTATVYIATTNDFSKGGHDTWQKVAEVPAKQKSVSIDLSQYGDAKFFKFAVKTPYVTLNRWLKR